MLALLLIILGLVEPALSVQAVARVDGPAFAMSADGRAVVTRGKAGTVQIWDTTDGEQLITLRAEPSVGRIFAWSPDGKRLVTAGNGLVRVWDHFERPGISLNGPSAVARADMVAHSPDGRTVAVGSQFTGTVKVYDGGDLSLLSLPPPARPGELAVIGFSPDGNALATGTGQKVQLWNPRTGELLRAVEAGAPVTLLAYGPDGALLATTGAGQDPAKDPAAVRLWNLFTGELAATLGHGKERLTGFAFAADAKTLATVTEQGTLRLWLLPGGGPPVVLQQGNGKEGLVDVAFAPDGKRVVAATATKVLAWDPATKELAQTVPLPKPEQRASDLAFTPDGTNLLVGLESGDVLLYEVAGWKLKATLDGRER